MFSIRVKITVISTAVILFTIMSVFVASYFTLQTENDSRSVEAMNLIAENTKQSLEKYTESIEQSVELVANIAVDSLDSVYLIEMGVAGTFVNPEDRTAEQSAELNAYLTGYTDKIQEIFSSVAGRTHGVISYYYCIAPGVCSTDQGFFYSRAGRTGFEKQEMIDPQELDPEDDIHTSWYYTAIERGRPSWIGPYKSEELGNIWCYSYVVPIYKSGSLIGTIGMDIPFDTLKDQVSPIRVYETGFACLLDEEGRILYHPEHSIYTTPDFSEITVQHNLAEMKNNGNELIRYTVKGQKRQMSFTTLSNGMKLAVVAPEAEINASWVRLQRITLIITIIGIIVCAVLVLIAMRIITNPLRELTVASQRLAAGDYNVELDYDKKGEVGDLTRAFIQMRDRTKKYIEDLNFRVHTDALTGLPNMRYFFTLGEEEKERLYSEGREPVLVYFNLTGLKHFNRQYGFEEGDKLICEFGQILARQFGNKKICHIGQDHFAAISDMEVIEEKLYAVFRECRKANGGMTLTVRAGIYQESLEPVGINIAYDRAKYACDKLRGSYVSDFAYFDVNMLKEAENVRYIINHLDQALAEQWIQVYYQPIVRSSDGWICDEESLARWIDPERGMLSPKDFVPILENASLIYKLDLYMLDHILEKMNKQKELGMEVVPHSLNLSRTDFEYGDIVEEIRRRVDKSGFSREMLTIEVTESIIGRDFDFMKKQVERFQELGFKVWMDDFGSGYSSLDVLQDIRFDVIKFDMRFIQRFNEGKESRIILTELVHMATKLGIDTVCEGVETREEAEFLKEIGCTRLQGYYFSRPIPFEEIVNRSSQGSFAFKKYF